jgi:MYXO-CTERM domain-containing protein
MARCDSADNCVIEGYCDRPVDGCGLPVVYGKGPGETLNCRLPERKVGVKVKMEPASAGVGSFQPVRVYLTNTPVNSWRKCVYELRLALEFNPDGSGKPRGQVAYVLGSALLQGGVAPVEEVVDEANQRVVLILGGEDDCLPAPGDGGLWVLDFLLVRGSFEDGWFKVNVWAPCDSPNEVMGCHADAGAAAEHQISKSWYSYTSGKSFEEGENVGQMLLSPTLGCQCGTEGRGGWGWLLLLLLAAVCRRYRI